MNKSIIECKQIENQRDTLYYCPHTCYTYTLRKHILDQAEDETIGLGDSFSKIVDKFGQQCGERSSSSIGNQQDESGDDEDEEEEEAEQEESEEEEEISGMRKRIKKRVETQKARLQAEKDTAQEKAKAAASKMHKLIMKAKNVKINTARTKDNKDVMLRVAEDIKELEATRRVLCRLSGVKKAHLSHTRIIHTHHTHVSYTRIIHTYRKELSRTSIEHT